MEQRTYEGMFMLDPTKAAQEWDNLKKQITGMIERRGGAILNAKKWGERKLAYEIKGHKRAAYLLVYFTLPSLNLNTLRRDLQLSELVMRTLLLARTKITQEEQQRASEAESQADNVEQKPEASVPTDSKDSSQEGKA